MEEQAGGPGLAAPALLSGWRSARAAQPPGAAMALLRRPGSGASAALGTSPSLPTFVAPPSALAFLELPTRASAGAPDAVAPFGRGAPIAARPARSARPTRAGSEPRPPAPADHPPAVPRPVRHDGVGRAALLVPIPAHPPGLAPSIGIPPSLGVATQRAPTTKPPGLAAPPAVASPRPFAANRAELAETPSRPKDAEPSRDRTVPRGNPPSLAPLASPPREWLTPGRRIDTPESPASPRPGPAGAASVRTPDPRAAIPPRDTPAAPGRPAAPPRGASAPSRTRPSSPSFHARGQPLRPASVAVPALRFVRRPGPDTETAELPLPAATAPQPLPRRFRFERVPVTDDRALRARNVPDTFEGPPEPRRAAPQAGLPGLPAHFLRVDSVPLAWLRLPAQARPGAAPPEPLPADPRIGPRGSTPRSTPRPSAPPPPARAPSARDAVALPPRAGAILRRSEAPVPARPPAEAPSKSTAARPQPSLARSADPARPALSANIQTGQAPRASERPPRRGELRAAAPALRRTPAPTPPGGSFPVGVSPNPPLLRAASTAEIDERASTPPRAPPRAPPRFAPQAPNRSERTPGPEPTLLVYGGAPAPAVPPDSPLLPRDDGSSRPAAPSLGAQALRAAPLLTPRGARPEGRARPGAAPQTAQAPAAFGSGPVPAASVPAATWLADAHRGAAPRASEGRETGSFRPSDDLQPPRTLSRTAGLWQPPASSAQLRTRHSAPLTPAETRQAARYLSQRPHGSRPTRHELRHRPSTARGKPLAWPTGRKQSRRMPSPGAETPGLPLGPVEQAPASFVPTELLPLWLTPAGIEVDLPTPEGTARPPAASRATAASTRKPLVFLSGHGTSSATKRQGRTRPTAETAGASRPAPPGTPPRTSNTPPVPYGPGVSPREPHVSWKSSRAKEPDAERAPAVPAPPRPRRQAEVNTATTFERLSEEHILGLLYALREKSPEARRVLEEVHLEIEEIRRRDTMRQLR